MHILGYILIWVLFLGFGALCEQRKENRKLKKQLDEARAPREIKRNFRCISA